MTPILQSQIGSLLRAGLMVLAVKLVDKGIWTESAAEGYVEAAIAILLSLGWSLWVHYSSRVHLLTALTLHVGATENDVKAKVASGDPVPTVTTPPNTIPGVPNP